MDNGTLSQTQFTDEKYETSNRGCVMLKGYMKLWFLLQLVHCKQWIDAEINLQTPDGLDDGSLPIVHNKPTDVALGMRLTPR